MCGLALTFYAILAWCCGPLLLNVLFDVLACCGKDGTEGRVEQAGVTWVTQQLADPSWGQIAPLGDLPAHCIPAGAIGDLVPCSGVPRSLSGHRLGLCPCWVLNQGSLASQPSPHKQTSLSNYSAAAASMFPSLFSTFMLVNPLPPHDCSSSGFISKLIQNADEVFLRFPCRSRTCGRCTRRGAGTSSPPETVSGSNMRTSWVKGGAASPPAPLKTHMVILKCTNSRLRNTDRTFLVRASKASFMQTLPPGCDSGVKS